jgi:ABC-type multidrug transport system ATPase subunit
MILEDKKGEIQKKKHILEEVWGEAKAGKTTAIMGASGAGKTTLFQTLAGRISSGGKITVESDVYLGGNKVNPMDRDVRRLFAYVPQHDALHESSTPRESLYFSAKLRLPKTTTHDEIDKLVNNCIQELGLTSCCDTIIGGKFKKGISGGEKRRVSIGIELVASPSILFLDEPTSGLDSYAAGQVMKLLAQVAKGGNTVLFTIHQPSSNVFCSFDRLILLNKGRVMHQGAVATICDDFSTRGYPVPPNYNPADWVLDVAQINSVEELERKGFFGQMPAGHLSNIRSSKTNTRYSKLQVGLDIPDRQHVSHWTEFQQLQKREIYSLYRNPGPMVINVGATSVLSGKKMLMFSG